MKRHFVLVVAILVLLGGMVYYFFDQQIPGLFFDSDSESDVETYLQAFRDSHKPVQELNLSGLYGADGHIELLLPTFSVKRLPLRFPVNTCGSGESVDDIQSLRGALANCQQQVIGPDIIYPEAKENAIRSHLASGETISEVWLNSPPYVSELGASYAYLLAIRKGTPYSEQSWIASHLSLFRPAELSKLLPRHQIHSPSHEILGKLEETEIKSMVNGLPVILTSDFLLLRNQLRLGFSPLSYWVYDRRDLFSDLNSKAHELVPYSTDMFCVQRIGNACWTYSSKTALSYMHRYAISIVVILAVGLIILFGAYFRYAFERKREQSRQRLSLQVLSHEFRTPVSSLLLLLEQLNARSERLEVNEQDLLIKASGEVFRLQRIIETSKNYLRAGTKKTRFLNTAIPSLNSWIKDFVAEVDSRVNCEFLKVDCPLETDVFWLRFILENLIQNAFAHGREPVFVRLSRSEGKVRITVEDQGVAEFASLKEMTEPFQKSHRSTGMGLGLNICKSIVDESGGRLEFSAQPTSFTLSLS